MRVCKWLQVVIPVRLVVVHIKSGMLHNCCIEPHGWPVCLRMVGGGDKVFRAQYYVYKVKELCTNLPPVVGWRVLRGAAHVDPVLRIGSSHCRC